MHPKSLHIRSARLIDPGQSRFDEEVDLVVEEGKVSRIGRGLATPSGARVIEAMAQQGVLGGVPVSRLLPEQSHVQDLIIVANTEVNSDDDRARFIDALRAAI